MRIGSKRFKENIKDVAEALKEKYPDLTEAEALYLSIDKHMSTADNEIYFKIMSEYGFSGMKTIALSDSTTMKHNNYTL